MESEEGETGIDCVREDDDVQDNCYNPNPAVYVQKKHTKKNANVCLALRWRTVTQVTPND